ncbi:hypothetical protein DFP72DRAFT_930190 [Ephemerocybe angulata]|uniref:Aldehyde dehydrogenase domain-containing protein n=1 Tax=Ephemerocybe angulata TaxID=980116 RepID=A0A8H6HBS6_9AGAR|nr:hypothetical protein DFP72DRAFT_930190 [Tulosesus angulatus]
MARRPNAAPRSNHCRDWACYWARVEECSGARSLGRRMRECRVGGVVGGVEGEDKARIEKRAKGVVLIIPPWNYATILIFQPLCGAIAAGCPPLNKPSEVVPTFSKHLSELVPKYLDHAAYHAALGSVPETTKILELKWARIARYHLRSRSGERSDTDDPRAGREGYRHLQWCESWGGRVCVSSCFRF